MAAQPLAQAHNAREGIDDAEAMRAGAGNEQAAIVGAEIKRTIGEAFAPGVRRSTALTALAIGRISPVMAGLTAAGLPRPGCRVHVPNLPDRRAARRHGGRNLPRVLLSLAISRSP